MNLNLCAALGATLSIWISSPCKAFAFLCQNNGVIEPTTDLSWLVIQKTIDENRRVPLINTWLVDSKLSFLVITHGVTQHVGGYEWSVSWSTTNLLNGDVEGAHARFVVLFLVVWHPFAQAQLPLSIVAPRKDLSELQRSRVLLQLGALETFSLVLTQRRFYIVISISLRFYRTVLVFFANVLVRDRCCRCTFLYACRLINAIHRLIHISILNFNNFFNRNE